MLGLAGLAAILASCFATPQHVRIDGWRADAMEPFLARDGRILFFNSSNAPRAQTDLYWASRIDPLRFKFRGPVPGANSPALDGVPSLARDGTFAQVSPRRYDALHATIWTGRWTGRGVVDLRPHPTLTPPGVGGFNMDAEISDDGRHLYFTDNLWNPLGPPRRSVIRMAVRTAATWRADAAADSLFAKINDADDLQYAPGLSADERELFFTRVRFKWMLPTPPEIWVTTRASPTSAFGAPARVAALTGFVEGPSIASDGAIYFHRRDGDRFAIMRSARSCR